MRVSVKLFAVLKERAGTGEVSLELAEKPTVARAAEALGERIPAIAKYLDRVAFAVNRTYVSKDTVLNDGDELALIPPVSGGSR